MPHQCVRCSKLYPDASKELLSGCECGSRFFFYIGNEYYEKMKRREENPIIISQEDRTQIEHDVREMIGIEDDAPVVLDLEAIQIRGPGKFDIDIVKLFNKKQPIVYKLEEGKYIIDLSSLQRKEK